MTTPEHSDSRRTTRMPLAAALGGVALAATALLATAVGPAAAAPLNQGSTVIAPNHSAQAEASTANTSTNAQMQEMQNTIKTNADLLRAAQITRGEIARNLVPYM